MIETNDAERIGMQPTAAAAASSAADAPGLVRGVFIGWSRPSVQTTRLARTLGRCAGAGPSRPAPYDVQARPSASAAVGVGTVSSSRSQTRSGS